MKKLLLIWVALITTCMHVWADDKVSFTASAPDAVAVGDQFRLSYTITTKKVRDFQAPSMKGFDVLMGPSRSEQSSVQSINGKTTSTSRITFTYILMANAEGEYTIPGASITADGNQMISNSVNIKVLPRDNAASSQGGGNVSANGRGKAIANNDLFITATVNKTNVYEQEAFLLTYKIYTAVDLRMFENVKLPDFKGFHSQEVELPNNRRWGLEHYKGRNYQTTIYRQFVLFPQQSGKLTIEPARFDASIAQMLEVDDPFEAFFNGGNNYVEIKKTCEFISSIQKEIGKPKFEYQSFEVNHEIYEYLEENYKDEMKENLSEKDKETRDNNIDKLTEKIEEAYKEKYGEEALEEHDAEIKEAVTKLEKACVREMIFKEHKRVDGRAIDEIRPLSCEVGVLPRTHGSALFTRGQTQVLSVATLGMISEEQTLDGIDTEESKRYMHHYNFPSYSVGEARPSRGPGRREIGHGALAEKALVPVIPSKEEFPYAIRVVSEVLSSNGSTSQASICGSTLALMDAGVPIKRPVAGISTGLVTNPDNDEEYVMLTDIQGVEDFFGDMDFKVGGTKKGITAIQVDIKCDGLTYDIIEEAFERTEKARNYILDNIMLPVISEPRKEVSKYAPRIVTTTINPDKIKDVIGPGGKMINKIIDETGVKIDIEEDGQVFIYSTDNEKAEQALEMVEDIAREIEVGGIYYGEVVRIMNFGAFVDLGCGGKEGLLHVSKISKKRIKNVEDVLHVGDKVTVKVIDIDEQGRINLSMKDLAEDKETEEHEENE